MVRNEKGFSLTELLISVAVISVISAIVVPTFLQSRIAVNEVAAIKVVGDVLSSQMTYASTKGMGSYSPDLSGLQEAGLLDGLLGPGTALGYTFYVSGSNSSFSIHARPLAFGSSGTRSFFSDQTGVIRYTTDDNPATATSPPLGQEGD